jgi:glycosyltransferase involved in cell wall biosynthesis
MSTNSSLPVADGPGLVDAATSNISHPSFDTVAQTGGGRRLNVLFVTSDKYPPFRPAARVLFGEELGRRGHKVDWLIQVAANSNYSGETVHEKGRLFLARTNQGSSRLARIHKYVLDILNDFRMFRLVRRFDYDIIQVKDKYLAALLALVAARIGKARFCYWLAYPHAEASLLESRGGTARYPFLYLLRGLTFKFLLYRIILPRADHVFVQSEQMRRDLAEHGVPKHLMTPVPGSISPAEFPTTVRREAGNQTAKRIVYLGTLLRTRKLDLLVRAHALVLKRHPAARLVFIGKGEMPEDEQMLMSAAQDLGILENIDFRGHMPIREAWEELRDADVGLSPYFPTPVLNSTSPTKLIEYMAMGLPVVANDHPEQRLVIAEAKCGYCVPWSESSFADAICAVLEKPEEAVEMGWRGRDWVMKHRTNAVMAARIENAYLEMCS